MSLIHVTIDGNQYEWRPAKTGVLVSFEKNAYECGHVKQIGCNLFYVAECFQRNKRYFKSDYVVYWNIVEPTESLLKDHDRRYKDRLRILDDLKSRLFECPSQNKIDRLESQLEFYEYIGEHNNETITTYLPAKKKKKKD